MSKSKNSQLVCGICGRSFPRRQIVSAAIIRDAVTEEVRRDHPDWPTDGFICLEDLTKYRGRHVRALLESERGELTALEHEVVDRLREHELLSSNVDLQFEREWTLGERLADRLAAFGGSWPFMICFAVFVLAWIALNTVMLIGRPIDPYPFILLNLILSCVAAVQAPVIMMSQNRQEAKDRLRSQHDYQVNLKAELEIRQLHEKVDHLPARAVVRDRPQGLSARPITNQSASCSGSPRARAAVSRR